MQAEAKPKAADAAGTNRPADARGEEQQVKGQHGADAARPAGTEQKAEREAITTLPNKVGFQFDSSKADQSEVKRVLGNMSPEQQAALKDPTATVILTGSTSRAGGSEHNMELSRQRAEDVAAQLRDSGVKAQIEIFAYGEQEAMDQGQPDGADDRDFRSVNVDVLPGQESDVEEQTKLSDAQSADLAQKWTDQMPDLSKVDTVEELGERGKIALQEFADAAKDVLSGNSEKALGKGIQAELGMFAEALEHKEYRANVSLNLIPAFLQEFDRTMLGPDQVQSRTPEVVEHPGAYRSPESKAAAIQAVRNGALLLHKVLDSKSPVEISEMKHAAKDMYNLAKLHRAFERVLHHKLNR